jgi:hypothetical protein
MLDVADDHPLKNLIENIEKVSGVYAGPRPVVEPGSLSVMSDGSVGVRVMRDFFYETSHDWWDPVVPETYVTLMHDVPGSLLVALRCYEGYDIPSVEQTAQVAADIENSGDAEHISDEAQ